MRQELFAKTKVISTCPRMEIILGCSSRRQSRLKATTPSCSQVQNQKF